MTENPGATATAEKPIIRHCYSDKRRVQLSFTGPGRTKQSFKDECNINNILKKYQRTGALTHLAKNKPQYGYASAIDFRECMDIVRKGEEMFAELPSTVRKRFHHDPAEFLEFVQNPDNLDEAVKLGLAKKRAQPSGEPATSPEGSDGSPATTEGGPATA